ncbi:MAG: extracellular solute-binding protein [Lachnospiraceae bacterium]|nr:extracellular solute-binding protein [Lachnospiraceae bacterium]
MKRLLAVCLILAIMAGTLAGCGKSEPGDSSGAQDSTIKEGGTPGISGGETQSDGGASGSEPTAMGRYVETAVDLSENTSRSYKITTLSDGRLLILDDGAGQLISSDSGMTWEEVPIPGIDNMKTFSKENYIFSMAAAPDGTVAVLSTENGEYDRTGTFDPSLYVAAPDGTVKTIDSLPVQSEDSFAYDIFYSPEGELFTTVVGTGTVYRVDVENGTLTKEVSLEWKPDLIKFQGDDMFFLTSREGITIYDRKEEKWVEDNILADFMEENYKDEYYANDSFSVYMTPGEDGVLYIAGKGGMYRHVIGGSVMEQIIDGALTSFSNPSMNMLGITAYGENEFAVLFSGGKVVLYKYDPDVPTVPENMISVYSLKEQDAVRQAIAQFQAETPDTFVRYEVGISGTDAKAAEDAIKKLNTELMAGKGPDVIIMDGLPVKSYEEKGILKDLKPHIDSLSGDAVLLPNIVEAFNHGGGVYTVPVYFQIPMLAGRQSDLESIRDYASLADAAERIRAEKPDAEIGRFFSEEATVRWFLPVAATAFVEESGGINEESLREYLSLTDRIYKTAQEGLTDTVKESYGYQKDNYKAEGWAYENFNSISQQADDFMVENMALGMGMLKNVYGYQEMLSLKYCDGYSDVGVKVFDGMSDRVFEPSVLVGLNASSGHQEEAERFFDIIMGTQVQSLIYDGFMVNQTALKEQLSPKWKIFQNGGMNVDYGEVSSSVGGSYGDGREFHLDIHMPTKEEFQELYDICSGVKTPYVVDTVVENAVIEIGAQYLQGFLSENEAVQKIKAKVELYMAE